MAVWWITHRREEVALAAAREAGPDSGSTPRKEDVDA
jgi:hypothetical protein